MVRTMLVMVMPAMACPRSRVSQPRSRVSQPDVLP